MDATASPVFAAVDRAMSQAQARMPQIKVPVDLLALIDQYGDAKYRYGAQSVSDRYHQDYADAPDMGPIAQEVERLQGAEFKWLEVASELLAKCSVSDDSRYGTLGTQFVRDVLIKALAEVQA